MVASVIAWDIETVPDLNGFAAANSMEGKSDDENRRRQAPLTAKKPELPPNLFFVQIFTSSSD
jgi:hypothetical protein